MENIAKKAGKLLGRLVWAAVLGAELTVAGDLLLGYCGHPISLGIFVLLWLVLTVALVAWCSSTSPSAGSGTAVTKAWATSPSPVAPLGGALPLSPYWPVWYLLAPRSFCVYGE